MKFCKFLGVSYFIISGEEFSFLKPTNYARIFSNKEDLINSVYLN